MDIRIGLADAPRELVVELEETTDVAALKADIESAISNNSMVWLTDRKGRQVGFRSDRVAFIDVGTAEEPKMGFG